MFLDNEFHKLLSVSSSPRILPKMKPVLDYIDHQVDRANLKLSQWNGYQTAGFRLLLNILELGMSDKLQSFKTDIEKLYGVLNFQRTMLTRMFDSSSGGGHSSRNFFIGHRSCKEYIFSVSPRNPLQEYPLDKGPDGWRKYRVLRYIDSDSGDQTLNITSGLLYYPKDHPHYAIFTLDPVGMILQYNALKDTVSIEQYIHKYVIMPALTLDTQRIWLLGIYSQWFYNRSKSFNDIPMITTAYSHIPQNLSRALDDITELYDSSRSGNVSIQRLLSSLPLPRNIVIPKYASLIYRRSSLDDVGEFAWGTFMIYRRMLDVAVRSLTLTVNNPDSQQHILRLKRIMDLIAGNKMASPIHDPYTKMFVQQSINSLQMQVETLYRSIKRA